MNNYDKITNMDIDEMAEFIKSEVFRECSFCKGYECDKVPLYSEKCIDGIKQWLQAESEG